MLSWEFLWFKLRSCIWRGWGAIIAARLRDQEGHRRGKGRRTVPISRSSRREAWELLSWRKLGSIVKWVVVLLFIPILFRHPFLLLITLFRFDFLLVCVLIVSVFLIFFVDVYTNYWCFFCLCELQEDVRLHTAYQSSSSSFSYPTPSSTSYGFHGAQNMMVC